MTSPDTLPRLAHALVQVSGQLREIGDELRTLQVQHAPAPTPSPAPQPVPAPLPPRADAPPVLPQAAPPPPRYPHYPYPAYGPAPQPPAATNVPPSPPRPGLPPLGAQTRPAPGPTLWERLSREGAGAKVLAWIGGGVTLAGVVLLLVLAVQRGYVGPLPRVLLGAGLGAALVGIGLFLHRTPAGRVGALAVAGTGFAGLFFDVVAATSIYDYLPAAGGLAAGLLVTAAAGAVAARWDSELLAVFAVAGCAITAPVLTHGFTDVLLVGFLLALQIAAAPVHLVKRWTTLALVSGVPPVLAVVIQFALAASTGRDAHADVVLTMCAVVTVVQLAAAVATVLRADDQLVATGLLLSAPVPTLLAAALVGQLPGAVVVAAAGALLLFVLAAERTSLLRVPAPFALAAGGAGTVAVFEAACLAFGGDARTAALLAGAVVLALLAERLRLPAALTPALVFGVAGVLTGLDGPLEPHRLAEARFLDVRSATTVGAMVTGLLLVAVCLVIARAATRVAPTDDDHATRVRWAAAGIGALYGATVTVFSVGLVVSPDERGFLIGHVLVTLSWTVAALVLLLRHLDSTPLRVAGLVLVGAAVVKLVVFDLASLSGIPRVLAFLGAGLVLLAAGARYATLVADRARSSAS